MTKKHILSILAIIAFVGGMLLAHVTSDDLQDQPVHSGVIVDVYAAEPEPEPAPPERTYFDVPLDHDLQDYIFYIGETYNIQPAVIVAMIHRESNFNQYCIGDDGRSAGLMQIQAKWHINRMIDLGCTDLFNPYQNITVGINYLAELRDQYGDIAPALTAYNQGSYKGTITNYATSIMRKAGELNESNGQ
jgi:soluble lytic murein transglycosylase-like protein